MDNANILDRINMELNNLVFRRMTLSESKARQYERAGPLGKEQMSPQAEVGLDWCKGIWGIKEPREQIALLLSHKIQGSYSFQCCFKVCK